MALPGVMSRVDTNLFSIGALALAVVLWSGVLHLSDVHTLAAFTPGTVLGALGVRQAIRKGQRQAFAWTAFGLNVVISFVAFVLLIAYLVGFRPEPGQGWL